MHPRIRTGGLRCRFCRMGSPQKEKEICQTEAVIQIGISRAGNPQIKVGDKPRVIIQGKGVYISPAVKIRYPEVIGILKQAPGVLAIEFSNSSSKQICGPENEVDKPWSDGAEDERIVYGGPCPESFNRNPCGKTLKFRLNKGFSQME